MQFRHTQPLKRLNLLIKESDYETKKIVHGSLNFIFLRRN